MPFRLHIQALRWRSPLLPALLLAALTLLLFRPAVGFRLVNLDDIVYISENQLIRDGLTGPAVRAAFSSFHQAMWAPGLWLSYMADVDLYGATARGFHLTNVLLHAANALLAFVLFFRWTGKPWRAFFTAAVWAWHPLRVESVAWVSARKDVLSGLLFLLCLLAYDLALRAPPAGRPPRPVRRRLWLACSLLALAAGLSVKPMLVSVPAVLLLLDAWPLRRLPLPGSGFLRALLRLVAEKTLYWLLIAASAGLAVAAHADSSSLGGVPLSTRFLSLPLHYAFYLIKTAFPARLTVLYPDLALQPFDWVVAAGLLLGLTAWAWRSRRQTPAVLIGWLWFLGVLLPASGIVRFGIQSLADRFTYLPALGLSVMLLPLFPARRPLARGLRLAGAAAVAATLAVLTSRQLPVWRNSDALHDRLLHVVPTHPVGLAQRAARLHRMGRLQEALDLADRACASSASTDSQHFLRVVILASQERTAEARDTLLALKLRSPGHAAGMHYFLLAMVCNQLGDFPEAARHARLASQALSPCDLLYRDLSWLGLAVAVRMDDPEAARNWARGLNRLRDRDLFGPDDLLPFYIGQWKRLQRTEAADYFRAYLGRHPRDTEALNNLAWLMATSDWSPVPPEEIVGMAQRAAEYAPGNPVILDTLAVALAHAGRFDAAEQTARRALFLLDAASLGASDLARAVARRIRSYQDLRPWREEQAADRIGYAIHAL